MQQTNSFNANTVDWQKTGVSIDAGQLPDYQADAVDITSFQRDGVVLLRGVFRDWVDSLRAGLQRNLDDPRAFAFPCESNPRGEAGRFFDSYCNWQLIPEYYDFLAHSCAASIAGQFMQGESAQFFHEHAFLKAPGTQRATPWHQDLPYYCVDGTRTASIYVSLDADEAVCRAGVAGGDWGGRSGDYSSTNIDPSSDTFWHTGEFGRSSSFRGWGTAVCEFRLAAPVGSFYVLDGMGTVHPGGSALARDQLHLPHHRPALQCRPPLPAAGQRCALCHPSPTAPLLATRDRSSSPARQDVRPRLGGLPRPRPRQSTSCAWRSS